MSEEVEKEDLTGLVSSIFMLGVEDPKDLSSIEAFNPGSIILTLKIFRDRFYVDEPLELEKLCQKLHEMPGKPLIGIDHEGGYIQYEALGRHETKKRRFSFLRPNGLSCRHLIPPHYTLIPPAGLITKGGDEKDAEELGRVIGKELRAVGIDWNFAPVADVSRHPKYHFRHLMRTFADDDETVGRVAAALTRGMQAEGVIACPKHYPGMGRTEMDSHMALPKVEQVDRETLIKTDLAAFRQCLEAGAQTVMTNHAMYPDVDDSAVATCSKTILTDILRDELGFTGLVLTDDMGMRGVREHPTLSDAQIAVEALKAGCDILMYSFRHERAIAARTAIIEAIEKGDIDVKIVKKAAKRLRKLKKWLRRTRADLEPLSAADLERIVPIHKELSKKIMESDTSFNRIGVSEQKKKNTVGSDAIELQSQKKPAASCITM